MAARVWPGALGWRHGPALAVGLALLLLLAPVLAVERLPLLDVPSHQARLVVLRHLLLDGTGSPFYEMDTLLLPNIGFDLVGLLLTSFVSPLAAARIYFGATLVLTLTGVLALSRVVLGRWSVAPLAAALLIYNLFTVLGFLSYSLGIALMFWALAARIWLERAGLLPRFLAGAAMGIVLLLCHVSAFMIYAVMLAGVGFDQLLRRHRSFGRVVLMGTELLPGVLLYLSMSTAGQDRMRYDWPFWHTKIFTAVKTITSASAAADVAVVVGMLALLLCVLLSRPRLHASLLPGIAVLAVLYFVVPQHISGGSYADSRIPVVAMMLCLAAVEVRPRHAALVASLCLLVAGAFAAKQAALTAEWSRGDRTLSQVAQALDTLPDGAVLVQATCDTDAADIRAVYESRQPPLRHVAAYAALEGKRFAAISWTIKGQQPIRTMPSYLPFKALVEDAELRVCSIDAYRAVLRRAQDALAAQSASGGVVPPLYLLLLRAPQTHMLEQQAQLVAEAKPVEVYRVDPLPMMRSDRAVP